MVHTPQSSPASLVWLESQLSEGQLVSVTTHIYELDLHVHMSVYVYRKSPMEGSPFIDDYIAHSEQVRALSPGGCLPSSPLFSPSLPLPQT